MTNQDDYTLKDIPGLGSWETTIAQGGGYMTRLPVSGKREADRLVDYLSRQGLHSAVHRESKELGETVTLFGKEAEHVENLQESYFKLKVQEMDDVYGFGYWEQSSKKGYAAILPIDRDHLNQARGILRHQGYDDMEEYQSSRFGLTLRIKDALKSATLLDRQENAASPPGHEPICKGDNELQDRFPGPGALRHD